MTSRERIKKTFEFKATDRVGISDDFVNNVIHKWRSEKKLPEDVSPQEYFDFDIRLFGFNQNFDIDSINRISLERINNPMSGENMKNSYNRANSDEKFLVLSCMEPFEHIATTVGKEALLAMMAEDRKTAARLFSDSSEFTLSMCQLLLEKGYRFDGAWLWGDLAHKKGLMFSTNYYKTFLFDLHREFCNFFSENDMPVIFHSDGDIRKLIPYFIEAGIRALEPLESNTEMDLFEIKREYGKDIILFGGIDEASFMDIKRAEKEITSKFKYLIKGGGYIYHADSPILDNVNFENYKYVIELVKRYGVY